MAPEMTKRITVKVEDAFHQRVVEKAWQERVTVSDAVRQLLEKWLAGEISVEPTGPDGEDDGTSD
jgi:anti-sigma factor RsiW